MNNTNYKKQQAADETFIIRDEKIDVNSIMKEIRSRIQKKKESGLYSDELLEQVERMKIADDADEKDYFAHVLKAANALWQIDVDSYRLGIPPILNKPVLARMVIWSKKLVRRLIRFHSRAIFQQQNEYNSYMVQVLNGLYEKFGELENKLAELGDELHDLKRKL